MTNVASKLFLVASLILVPLQATAQTNVTVCGQTVSDGLLVADLDCSATDAPAVTVSRDGSLDLAGHTIHAGTEGGVFCEKNCTVDGNGGAIVGLGGGGSPLDFAPGIYTVGFREGRNTHDDIVISDLGISDFTGQPLSGGNLKLDNVVLGDHYWNVTGVNMEITNCVSGARFYGRRVSVTGSSFSAEINGATVKLTDTTVAGSRGVGVVGGRVRLLDSTVLGNCVAPTGDRCADIATRSRPRLQNSNCGTSRNIGGAASREKISWYVCQDD